MTPRNRVIPNILQAALSYAARGIPVFPCLPGSKQPAIKRGFHAATTNPETIKRYWRDGDRNVAIPTGMISGIWVLDIDGEGGESSLRDLESLHGGLPRTCEVITGRGRHLWFTCNAPIPCSTGRLGPGLDVKGDGGCCTVPPSVHESGRVYRWNGDADHVAVAPDWLVDLARKKPRTISERAVAFMRGRPAGMPAHDDRYGQAALRNEIAALAGPPRAAATTL